MIGMDGERGDGSGVGVAVEEEEERREQGEGGGGGGGEFLEDKEEDGEEEDLEEDFEDEEGEAGSWGGHLLQLRSRRSLKKSFGVKMWVDPETQGQGQL